MKNNKEVRKLYVKLCRYYDGSEAPASPDPFWGYEETWVELCMQESTLIVEYVEELHNYLPSWCNNDDAPLSLKALLLNRYLHFCGRFDKNDFTRWFKDIYMAGK